MFTGASTLIVLLSLPGQAATTTATPDRPAYEAARAGAGDDPAKLVELALWCEAHGMAAEKKAHLEQAARLDPRSAAAHGLLGLMDVDGRWVTPESAAEKARADADLNARLAEYNQRRELIERQGQADEQQVDRLENAKRFVQARALQYRLDRRLAPHHIKLALWCEQNGLKAEALAHFMTAVQLNPHDETTWKHIGYVKHDGRWISREQLDQERQEADAQRHADRHWEPLLRKWSAQRRDKARRPEAEANLEAVHDAAAVPSIIRVFCDSSPVDQALAVRMLGRIDATAATKELAYVAVFSDYDEVREAAAQALKERSPRDYAEILVNRIHTPVTFQYQPVAGPGTQGGLMVDSPRFLLLRVYTAPAAFRISSTFGGIVGYDGNGLPMLLQRTDARQLSRDLMNPDGGRHTREAERLIAQGEARAATLLAAANLKARIARQRLAADVQELTLGNARAEFLNSRIGAVLRIAMDAPENLGDDEDAWRSWYYETVGYRYTPPPKVTITQDGALNLPAPVIVSCFAAGTPVRTRKGPRPIESIRAGDQVLARDVATGALSFEPVLMLHRNPPDATLRITTDAGDAVVASRFHRFWKAGEGWVMARDLSVGDTLRMLSGRTKVVAVEAAPVQPVFNLDVAGPRTYFVGPTGLLVHDNRLPPAHPEPPFDRVTLQ